MARGIDERIELALPCRLPIGPARHADCERIYPALRLDSERIGPARHVGAVFVM